MENSSQLENRLLTQYFSAFPEKSTSHLEEYSDADAIDVILEQPASLIAKILTRMKSEKAGPVFVDLPDEKFKEVHEVLDPVRGSHLLSKSEQHKRDKKISILSDSEQKDILELCSYPANSAGSLMDLSLRICRAEESVKEVLFNIRNATHPVREVFIIDIAGKLIGYLPVQELLDSADGIKIADIMHKDPPSVNALSPKDEVVEVFETFKTTVLPVIHVDGSLLGAIRYTSLVQAVQNQALAAMASLGGASPSEQALSPPLFSVGKRLPWLAINLLTAFIASAVVGYFENTIAKVTALAVLLPIVAGQSGNTGAQAMAVTMRGLALREVRTRQWLKILFKELRVGFVNGVAIAIVTGASVYFWSNNLPLGAVMTVAMIFSMVIASMAGAGIPVILTAMGKDPAQSSSVILTTVTDVMGFLSFLGLATIFISMLLGA